MHTSKYEWAIPKKKVKKLAVITTRQRVRMTAKNVEKSLDNFANALRKNGGK